MKNILDFIKTCLLGGLFVLMPLLIFYMLLNEIVNVLVAIATPIADLFPEGTFDVFGDPLIIAIFLLVMFSFVFGLALRSAILSRLGSWVERTSLEKLPMYQAVKQLTKGLIGAEGESVFSTGLLRSTDNSQELVYIVEELDEGKLSVIIPTAPGGFSGRVKIVDAERVMGLRASVGDASKVLAQWGFGMSQILEPKQK
jgi:uncharacterized membrane protein